MRSDATPLHGPRALAAGLLIGLACISASATEPESPEMASPAEEGKTALDRVEVVGSRIKRIDIETWKPVLVLERVQLEQTGMASVGEILQSLQVHGASFNTTFNNGGDGTTRIDLRNLGDQRTLVLVDGRRWIPGIDGAVDLNSIPLAMIERIEVLKDGASAIYGSDAIAGVVSLTTRRDFEGHEARAQIGAYEQGDGRTRSLELTSGWAGEAGHLSVSLSHQRQDPVFARDREISAVPVFGLPPTDVRAGASLFTPFGLFGFGSRGICPFNPAGTYPANGVCPSPDGRPGPLNRSTLDPVTGDYRLFDLANDGYNYAQDNYLLTPQERSALFLNARRELGDTVTASLQVVYNERLSSQELAPNPIMLSTLFGGANNVVVPADHVHNPFGQPVTSMALRPGRQLRRFGQDADTVRIAAGLSGIWDVGGRFLSWGADAVFGRYDIEANTEGLLDPARLRLALGPSFRDAGGVARCGTRAAVVDGCVPLDAFHGPDALTPEMLGYLYYAGQDRTRTESRLLHLHLDGDLLELPAGSLAFAAGYEYRREAGNSRLDPRRVATQGITDTSYGGRQSVHEAYLELSAPLLDSVPGASLLETSAALRHSRYDSFGSTSNLEAGLRWKPIEQLMVRVSHAEGFRAPIVSELYFPITESFDGLQRDPCAAENQPDATQRANCAADGVPGGQYDPAGALFDVLDGGNAALRPESSRSRSAGLVWNPPWATGFDLSLDWYRVHIADAISQPDYVELLHFCADAGVPEACDRTLRDANGELLAVDARQLNSGELEVEGWDLGLNYRRNTSLGLFTVALDASHMTRYSFESPRGSGRRSALGNVLNREPSFHLRSNLSLSWQRGAWSASTIARYYSALDEACINPAQFGRPELCSDPDLPSQVIPGFPSNRLATRTYVDLQAGWETPWDGRVVFGLRNAFDRNPPISYSTFANSFDPAYPLPGRFWYAQLVQRF